MTIDTRVTVSGDKELALYELETRFAMATRQRALLENYIKERLKPAKHFYTIGEGQKPSLTKEGAELICLPHALKGHYHWQSGPETPPLDDAPYQITIKCELEANGKFAGEGIGSASSMVTRRDGTRAQRQKDPGLRHNATIKMACKSAYIAATLNSTAASEFFTQDLEDDQAGDFGGKTEGKNEDKTEHWCKEHNTAFFMRGKMKSFAHPIGDTGEWCHEHKEAKTEPVVSFIDLNWLKENLTQAKWSNKDAAAWITNKFNVTGTTLSESVSKLTKEQSEEFVNEVNGRISMA